MTGGNQFGTSLRYSGYTANNLNQITSRTVPPYVNVLGTATNNATVTVNNAPTYRKGDYWHRELSVDNGSALWLGVTNIAVQRDGANPDKVTNIVGNIFVPPAAETITYDADGNTATDGRWVMSWDAENRLTNIASSASTPLASRRQVVYAYDYQGRMLRRTAYDLSSGTNLIEDLKFVYDGWRCMAEINVTGGATVRSYVWGLDISGSMGGAGGVGGLLAVYMHDTTTFHFPFYDGNGNIAGLVNGGDGTVSANYEYDAFGKIIRQGGPIAEQNRFRFSSKYTDDETDLVYYGYRFYEPSTGRWINRDPIEEKGGINLYGFVGNDPCGRWDLLGKESGVGVSLGGGAHLVAAGGMVSVSAIVTTRCRLCVSVSTTVRVGPGVAIHGGAGPTASISKGDLEGCGFTIGLGGVVVEYIGVSGGIEGNKAGVSVGGGRGELGTGFAFGVQGSLSCTGCAPLWYGPLAQYVAVNRALKFMRETTVQEAWQNSFGK